MPGLPSLSTFSRPRPLKLWQGMAGFSLLLCLAVLVLLYRQLGITADHAIASGQLVQVNLADGSVSGHPYVAPPVITVPKVPAANAPVSSKPTLPEAEVVTPTPAAPATPAPTAPLVPTGGSGKTRGGLPALAPAPAEKLQEATAQGTLPRRAADGTSPWVYYAKPFPLEGNKPMVSVIITGLGMGQMTSEAAIALPESFTLSFSAYARDAALMVGDARAAGHEVLIDLPVQSRQYTTVDPGPYGLTDYVTPQENTARLHWVLSRFAGFVGLLLPQDASDAEVIRKPLGEATERGLMLLDFTGAEATKAEAPQLKIDQVVDESLTKNALDDKLATLEATAKTKGYAIGVAKPYPITLQQLTEWQKTLEQKGILLAPVSAVARRSLEK